MDKRIREIIDAAKFVLISKESSKQDLLEIIESQLGFWDELEEYLSPGIKSTNLENKK